MTQHNNDFDIQNLKNTKVYKFSFANYNARKFIEKEAYLKSQLRFRIKAMTLVFVTGFLAAQGYRLYKYFQYDIDIATGKVSEYVLDRFK